MMLGLSEYVCVLLLVVLCRTYILGPVQQCADNTVLGRYGMLAIPLQVLVSVGGLSLHSG